MATQANVNVGYGPRGIDLLKQGLSAKEALDKLLADDKFDGKDGRQIAIVDAQGRIAAFTGPKAPNWAGDRQGKTWSAQGNILVGAQVPEAMGRAFDSTEGELAEKLFAALKAGDDAGGDSRGKQSASILVVRKLGGRNTNNDRYVYINVDDNPAPIVELRRLLDLNLGYLYQDQTFKRIGAGDFKAARDAAAGAARYMPNRADVYVSLGLLEYAAGNKGAAAAAFRAGAKLDPKFRQRVEGSAKIRPQFQGLLEDAAFLKEVFGE